MHRTMFTTRCMAVMVVRSMIAFGIGLSTAPGPAHAQAQRMPPGAYLRKPATTVAQLDHQVASDPVVANRYAALFNMSPTSVRRAMRRMKLVRLKADQTFKVFYVHRGERLGYRLRVVKKGTPVFVLPNGTPALIQICGNPLRSGVESPSLASAPVPKRRPPDFNPWEPIPGAVSSFERLDGDTQRVVEPGSTFPLSSYSPDFQGSGIPNLADDGTEFVFVVNALNGLKGGDFSDLESEAAAKNLSGWLGNYGQGGLVDTSGGPGNTAVPETTGLNMLFSAGFAMVFADRVRRRLRKPAERFVTG